MKAVMNCMKLSVLHYYILLVSFSQLYSVVFDVTLYGMKEFIKKLS